MKYLLTIICALTVITFSKAQNITYVNKSVCSPENMEQGDINNEYVQGSGHNAYLSYSVDNQVGSFGEQVYPVGSEENPLIIYETPDSLEREGTEQIIVMNEGQGRIDDENAYVKEAEDFVDSGVFEFRKEDNYDRFPAENYVEVESEVWTCVLDERESEM